jgi:hypothetical protein
MAPKVLLEPAKAASPCLSVPSPTVSANMATMKSTAVSSTVPNKARGMFLRAVSVSSPSAAHASNPARINLSMQGDGATAVEVANQQVG